MDKHQLILYGFTFSAHVGSRERRCYECQRQKCQLAVEVEREEILPSEHNMPNTPDLWQKQHCSKLEGQTDGTFLKQSF